MNESGLVHDACRWCYSGVWGMLTEYFRLPNGPPTLPAFQGESVEYLRPSIGYLNYRKFGFWIGLLVVDIVLLILWIIYSLWWPMGGLLTAPLWIIGIVVPDIIAYIAIHLKYDTTWYVLSDRSMRIRRGIWSIYETTITFENIQNVHINQGPVQRWFGFANLMVTTAGGGGGGTHEGGHSGAHVGILEGVDNAAELRQRILAKSQSTTGIDDDDGLAGSQNEILLQTKRGSAFNATQLGLLREIYEYTSKLANTQST
jgi:uncharacterized membrane protein YdbT with pleckstrin-like domain